MVAPVDSRFNVVKTQAFSVYHSSQCKPMKAVKVTNTAAAAAPAKAKSPKPTTPKKPATKKVQNDDDDEDDDDDLFGDDDDEVGLCIYYSSHIFS